MLYLQEVLDTLRRKGEREVVFTNCKDQYHPSVEQVWGGCVDFLRQ